ncbi:MAG: trypsin-like serine protease [Synechococcaceae cyanobacterium SM2_3_1]|nr:trypsin-like serine protease [Synechococcaceae cyanobacterium SM2_3_1]
MENNSMYPLTVTISTGLLAVFSMSCGTNPSGISLNWQSSNDSSGLIAFGESVDESVGIPYPFMAGLRLRAANLNSHPNTNGRVCGGALIDESWVATAGHCLQDPSGNPLNEGDWEIIIGTNRILSQIPPANRFPINKFVQHPDFSKSFTGLSEYDIGLIELSQATSYPPIEMANNLPSPSSLLGFLGWGRTESAITPDILQFGDAYRRTTCFPFGGNLSFTAPPFTFCTIDKNPLDDGRSMKIDNFGDGITNFCAADSGGPVFSIPINSTEGKYSELHGLISLSTGNGCFNTNIDAYTNPYHQKGVVVAVHEYSEWIDCHINGLSKEFSFNSKPNGQRAFEPNIHICNGLKNSNDDLVSGSDGLSSNGMSCKENLSETISQQDFKSVVYLNDDEIPLAVSSAVLGLEVAVPLALLPSSSFTLKTVSRIYWPKSTRYM